MRIRACFLNTIVALLLANGDLMAAEGTSSKAESSSTCGSTSVVAFGKTVKGVLERSKRTQRHTRDVARKDPILRNLATNARATVAIVESYLRCNPSTSASEVEIAIMTLQRLSLDAYLDFVARLAHAGKSEAGELGLYYAVAPGFPWSLRLALNYTDARVKSTLDEVDRSPNATPALQRMVLEIRDGSAAKKPEEPSPPRRSND